MKYCPLFIFIYGISLSVHAQNFRFKSYTEKDGLSNNEVNAVIQDKQGFLWIATSNGLDRFDGNSFDNFFNDPNDSASIGGNDIQCLFVDRKNRMWIGTNDGISLYHPLTQSFSNYAPDTTVLSAIGISFQALCDDERGNLWVGTKNDLLIFNDSNKQFVSSGWAKFADGVISANANRSRVIILSIIKKEKDELWILTTYGLFSVNVITHGFQYYSYPAVDDFHGAELRYADDRNNVWISLYTGSILCYNAAAKKWMNYQTPAKFNARGNAYCVTQFRGDTLMYCLGNSVFFFSSTDQKTLYDIAYVPEQNAHVVSTVCKNVLRQENFLWVGTNKGLLKVTSDRSSFHFYKLGTGGDVSRVFSSASSGNIIFSRNDETFVQKNNGDVFPIYSSGGKQVQGNHQYFAESNNGDAYINDDENFYLYDQLANKATPIPLLPKRNRSNSYDIRNMVIDKNGTVWIRTLGQGILTYQPQNRKMFFENSLPVAGYREINALYYDSLTHSLWIAEEFNGIFIYDIEKRSSQHFLLNSPSSERRAAILSITGDGKGNVWMSNLLSGIVEYNYASKKFIHYTHQDGLVSDKTAWVCLDAKGFLWICTDAGLSRMDTAQKKFTNYYTNEGFPSTDELFLSRDNKGNIYMPYASGYYKWNDDDLEDHSNTGSIYLRKAELLNRKLPVNSEYKFSYSQNSLQFLFGWLSFANNPPEYIEYRLNDNPWLQASLHSNISFANLAPGRYNLSVRNKNDPANFLHLEFIIVPPFWQQWWFISLVSITIAFMIVLTWKRRLNSVRRQSLLKNQVIESEMSALRSQMNPHFIFNTLNSINSYIIENRTQQASDYLTDFGSLMRIVLDHSRKRSITLDEEIRALKLYLELEFKRLDGSFDYRIEIQPSLDTSSVEIPPLIIQPFVENAIWHGLRNKKTPGQIDIELGHNGDELQISITDNGIGRAAAEKQQTIKEKRSFGSLATIKRIRLVDPKSKITIDDLVDENGNAAGTRVNIFLKTKKYS